MGLFKKKDKTKSIEEEDLYYNLKEIMKYDCPYNVIYGERSSGKTYAALYYCLEQYFNHHKQFAYLRRWEEDFRGKRGASLFAPLINNGVIKKLSNGEYNSVEYYSGRFYLSNYDPDKGVRIRAPEPFGYAFALSTMEHDKSTSYPNVNTIVFDEFLTRTSYLVDEFVIFCNVLSTIIRDRSDVKVFMLGNSVNQYCPYFKEMGLKHIKEMEPGDIDVYTYSNNNLKVAVEFTGGGRIRDNKPSDFYFAFDNPKLQMITSGAWELGMYPHLFPHYSYRPKDIRLTYYIEFDGETVRCDLIKVDRDIITYIHPQTREIPDKNKHLIYSTTQCIDYNYRVRIDRPSSDIENTIWEQFKFNKVYYQDNEIGDFVMNYINWCIQQ